MRKIVLNLVILTLLLTCSSKRLFDHSDFAIGISQGVLNNKEIDEASGLVCSVHNTDMLWTHNDSGDAPRIFLINNKGKHKATVYLKGIVNRDWEDISIGPGPEKDKSYLYIGDIGDNFSFFNIKYIYRIPEPIFTFNDSLVAIDTTITRIDSIKFQLPDGARDSEALMVDPTTGHVYIISKREEKKVNLYVLPYPQSTKKILTARFVMHIPFTQIVAADISADGKEVLIKNYKHVYYWRKEGDESLEELLKKEPAHLPYAAEPQGEAIAFSRSGKGYYTVSEMTKQKKPHLMFYRRKTQDAIQN